MHGDDLLNDLANLIGRHPDVTGREFVQACTHAAESYFEPSDLPVMLDAGELLAEIARGLREAGAQSATQA